LQNQLHISLQYAQANIYTQAQSYNDGVP